MPQFRFSAVGADGQAVKGTVDAISALSLENDLLMQGHSGIKVRERRSFTQIEVTKERVPRAEVMHFSRQLAAFVQTGIPITEAIRISREGASNKRFKTILGEMEEALQAGQPFSSAVAANASVFPPYYVSILRSAELTGQLDVVLEQLALYIERDLDARSKVVSALIYPAVILAMSLVTVLVMVTFVLPRFVVFFEDLDAELPLPTRMLLGFAEFTSSPLGIGIAIAIVVTIAGIWLTTRSGGGRVLRHRVTLRVPIVGDIVRYSAIERFCRVVAAMMRAGVPISEAMASAVDSSNNGVFERGLTTARTAMIEGDGIAGPIDATELFPLAAVQMIRVGEETGTLDQQLDAAAKYYSGELDQKLKRLTTLFEPAVILMMGAIVGFVAVALISAMYGVLGSSELS